MNKSDQPLCPCNKNIMGITEGTAPNISFKEHRHEQDPDIIEQHRMWLVESEYREQDELGHPDEDLAEHSLIGMKKRR